MADKQSNCNCHHSNSSFPNHHGAVIKKYNSPEAQTATVHSLLQMSSKQKVNFWKSIAEVSTYNDLMIIQETMTSRIQQLKNQQCLYELHLADEIIFVIFQFCDVQTLATASRVCRRWHQLLKDNLLWKHLYEQHHALFVLSFYKRKRKINCLLSPTSSSSVSPSSSPSDQNYLYLNLFGQNRRSNPHDYQQGGNSVFNQTAGLPFSNHPMISPVSPSLVCSEWKKVYRNQVGTVNNWKRGQYRVKKMDMGTLCVSFDERHVASIMVDDGELSDMESGNCLIRFTGHQAAITTVKFDDDFVVTASKDSTMKIWDKATGQVIRTLIGHQDEVGVVEFDSSTILVSGSEDRMVRVWDFNSGECRMVLQGHGNGITCLQFDSDHVVSGSADFSIRVWKLEDGELLKIISIPFSYIYTLQFDNESIIAGDDASHIHIWDFESGKLVRTLTGHHQAVLCLQFDKDKIVTGSADRTIKVWDRRTGFCMYTLRAHRDMIWNLRFTSNKLISSSIDQTLAIWDFSHVDEEFPVD